MSHRCCNDGPMNRSKAGADQRAKSHSADFCSSIWPKAPAGALSDWLAAELRRAISDRRLAIGSRLPASRLLAAELQVSRGVVTEAYQRLSENGQVIGRRRAGTS